MKEPMTQNNFEVLSIPEDQVLLVLEEGEITQSQNQTSEEVIGSVETDLTIPMEGHSPTYPDMAKKRNLWTILAHPMKIPLRGLPKKGKNLIRRFGRKNSNVLRCKESKPI